MTKDLYFAPKMKRSNFWGGPVTWTFKKLSYEKKLGLYFSLVTSLILKYFQTWASSKTNRKNQEKGVISWREQWPPLSCLHAKCLWSVWIILEYWNSYKKCFVRIKRAKKKQWQQPWEKKRLNRCCIFIVQGMKFLLKIIWTKGLWQSLRQLHELDCSKVWYIGNLHLT